MAEYRFDLDLIEDGWVGVRNRLPGWEGFDVAVKVGRVSGAPRVVGLRLEPRDGARPADLALTQVRLRRFPLGALAGVAYRLATLRPTSMPELMTEISTAAHEVSAVREDSRQATTVEHVARVYNEARRAAAPPRKAVCEVLHVSERTADRYISKASSLGLLDGKTEVVDGE
jgi:hypothetical protein